MTIAIFGRSLTGKSTLAIMLARELCVPFRSCGDAIRAAAQEAGERVETASDDLHKRVDEKTRTWIASTRGIVEGRFLDAVLDVGVALMIELRAEAGVRLMRLSLRSRGPVDVSCVGEVDRFDDLFRSRLYNFASRTRTDMTYDTSLQTPDDTLSTVLRDLSR